MARVASAAFALAILASVCRDRRDTYISMCYNLLHIPVCPSMFVMMLPCFSLLP
jgi:hypothetical protein